MKRKAKKTLLLFSILCIATAIAACGGNKKKEKKQEDPLANLKNDTFYVLHSDNTIDKLLTCNASFTFNEDVADEPSNERTIWLKEDEYNKIPTLYPDDKLIYHTTEIVNEDFTFERFEDFGYSIGMRGLTVTNSGRYCISTKEEDKTVFPSTEKYTSDTADILTFKNESVILDEFGGAPLRALRNEKGEFVNNDTVFSRCGTILGLTKDKEYEAKIYSGTELYEYTFKADKRIMGSMETTKTVDYSFEKKSIAIIDIPEYFNNGYYSINGKGIFRYVTSASFNENTDFNIRNIPSEDTNNIDCSIYDDITSDSNEPSDSSGDEYHEDGNYGDAVNSFTIEEEGTYVITVEVQYHDSSYNDEDSDIVETSAFIVNPSRTKKWTLNSDKEELSVTINASEKGRYSIYYSNTDNRDLHLNIEKAE